MSRSLLELINASDEYCIPAIKKALKDVPEKNILNTALRLAIQLGHFELIQLLIDAGSEPIIAFEEALAAKSAVLQYLVDRDYFIYYKKKCLAILNIIEKKSEGDNNTQKILVETTFQPKYLAKNIAMFMKHLKLNDSQHWLIGRIQQLGYEGRCEGVCQAIAIAGMQAVLTGFTVNFQRRLQAVAAIPHSAFKIKINSLQKKRGEELAVEEQDLLDFADMCDGIALIQFHNDIHKDLRSALDTNSLVLPYNTFLASLDSVALEKKGGMKRLGSMMNSTIDFKNQESTMKFFFELRTLLEDQPIGAPYTLFLNGYKHGISIGYDVKRKKWIFIDANYLEVFPPEMKKAPHLIMAEFDYHAIDQIVKHSKEAFSFVKKNAINLEITLLTAGKTKKNIFKRSEAKKEFKSRWLKLHEDNFTDVEKVDLTPLKYLNETILDLEILEEMEDLNTINNAVMINHNSSRSSRPIKEAATSQTFWHTLPPKQGKILAPTDTPYLEENIISLSSKSK
ncbi:MAG: hypothetical protein H0W64_09945 [Gammaproteobacteria bacterium]|nr:hypothetical protein [Gammaproteobacteria bacterium]